MGRPEPLEHPNCSRTTDLGSTKSLSSGASPYRVRNPPTKIRSPSAAILPITAVYPPDSISFRHTKQMGGTVQVGRFSKLNRDSNLIMHITQLLAAGRPLNSLKLEELKIIKLTCLLIFNRGLECMLVRETLHNSGVSDNIILNRKTCPQYWLKLHGFLKNHPALFKEGRIYNELAAAEMSQVLTNSSYFHEIIHRFIGNETGMVIRLPTDLIRNGNFLFSLGAVYSHRFFRLISFFNRHWGVEEYEPVIRVICQKMWFFYLIAWGKLHVSNQAFSEQRTDHELGIFGFIIEDYRTFTGTLYQNPPTLTPSASKAIEKLTNVENLSILY
ncbi:B79 [miniopterid betaherpesvirus 1]|uniref:B79 n=1 Tax=miniopterid betaherpesvirus 1 TaxID=3070189 RepID=I3VQ73_9BETA|nr:B79 [miniopterid betaherpesvirus 1]AFK83917.1 B79 [miniopterid betaherpesvirus 1]